MKVGGIVLDSERKEGHNFRFERLVNGTPVIADRCSVVMRQGKPSMFSISRHAVEKTGRQTVRKLMFKDVGSGASEKPTARLVYLQKGTKLLPFWEVSIGRLAVMCDATKEELP